jgi:hypothetical protein
MAIRESSMTLLVAAYLTLEEKSDFTAPPLFMSGGH